MTIWRINVLHLPHLHKETQELIWSIILYVSVVLLGYVAFNW